MLGYGAALALLHVGKGAVPISWWRQVAVTGALLVAASTLAAIVDRRAPPRATRPGAELLASTAIGALAFLVAFALGDVVANAMDLFPVAAAVFGAGLTATGWLCRYVVERPGGALLRTGLVLALLATGGLLAHANHAYTYYRLLEAHNAEAAAVVTLREFAHGGTWVALVPTCLAVGLPTLARALSWGLPAQVIVGMTGAAAGNLCLDVGVAWYVEGVPVHAEVLAGCLVPVACALAAHRARRARPNQA